MSDPSKIESALLALGSIRALLYTDSNGRLVRAMGPDTTSGSRVASSLDICQAAIAELGSKCDYGSVHSAGLMFQDTFICFTPLPSNETLYVLFDGSQAQLGLILAHLRNLRSAVGLGLMGIVSTLETVLQ